MRAVLIGVTVVVVATVGGILVVGHYHDTDRRKARNDDYYRVNRPVVDNVTWIGAAAIATVAAFAAPRFTDRGFRWLAVIPFVMLYVAHDWVHPKYRGKVRAYAYAGGWIAWAVPFIRSDPSPWLAFLVAIAVLCAMTSLIGVYHLMMQHPKFRSRAVSRMESAAIWNLRQSTAKLSAELGVQLSWREWIKTQPGFAIFYGVIGTTWDKVQAKRGEYAGEIGLNEEQVDMSRGANEADVRVDIKLVDTLAKMPGFPLEPDEHIETPFNIGLNEYLEPIVYPICNGHGYCVGGTRSGKTHLAHLVALKTVASIDGELLIISPVKGLEWEIWRPMATGVARGLDESVEWLRYVADLQRWRHDNRDPKHRGNWKPGIDGSQLVVIVEESTALASNTHAVEALNTIGREGAGAGIHLLCLLQRKQHQTMDPNIAANIVNRWCLHVDEKNSGELAIPGIGERAMALPQGGYFLTRNVATKNRIVKGRTWNVDHDRLDAFALTHRPADYVEPERTVTQAPASPEVKTQADRAAAAAARRFTAEERKVLEAMANMVPSNRTRITQQAKLGNIRTTNRALEHLSPLGYVAQEGDLWAITHAGREAIGQEVSA